MTSKPRPKRSYYYATVCYPDSLPNNWLDIIESWHVPCFVSPLHDRDFNGTGEHKKEPHYHIFLMFDSLKTKDQAIELFSQISGKGCEMVNSARSYARYLLHLDNPNKAQYDRADLKQISTDNYDQLIESLSDQVAAIKWVEEFIDDYDIVSFYELQRKLQELRPEYADMFRISKVFYIQEYIKSRYWHLYKLPNEGGNSDV